jgi:quercetin dioxygenase-like cupin family protein
MKMEQTNNSGSVPASQAVNPAKLVEYADGSVVSRTIHKSKTGTMTLFAFDKGQELSEHSAPFDAYVQILDGSAVLIIGGERVIARAGEMVVMPANVSHAVVAEQRFKMFLTMIRD